MVAADSGKDRGIRFEPRERAPPGVALGLGLQIGVTPLVVAILVPTIAFRAAGAEDALLAWVVFVSLLVCGLAATLQAVRFGRIGGGFILAPTVSAAGIAVATDALRAGGPSLLAVLVASAALIQMLLSARLSWLRRILTPTVSATVVLLLVISVMPVIFGMLDDVPDGAPAAAGPVAALSTLFVICAVSLKATGVWRLWAPLAGLVVGSLVAAAFGLYDTERVAQAAWFALPEPAWPGLDLSFGPVFWALLPAFGFVTVVTTMQTITGSLAIQNVSYRQKRAVDFRAVQNAVGTGGASSLLGGLLGTMPLSNLSIGASVASMTGRRVAVRRVRDGRSARGPCLRAESPGSGPVDTRRGPRGLYRGADGDPVRGRTETARDRRVRPSEGTHRRSLLLDRARVPVRPDLPGTRPGLRGRPADQRDDLRRSRGDSPHGVRAADRTPGQPAADRSRPLGGEGPPRVPGRIRIAQRLREADGRASRGGGARKRC